MASVIHANLRSKNEDDSFSGGRARARAHNIPDRSLNINSSTTSIYRTLLSLESLTRRRKRGPKRSFENPANEYVCAEEEKKKTLRRSHSSRAGAVHIHHATVAKRPTMSIIIPLVRRTARASMRELTLRARDSRGAKRSTGMPVFKDSFRGFALFLSIYADPGLPYRSNYFSFSRVSVQCVHL